LTTVKVVIDLEKIKEGLETPSVEPPPVTKGEELGKSIDWSVGVMLRYRTHRAIMT
jgi:hypothetical protein